MDPGQAAWYAKAATPCEDGPRALAEMKRIQKSVLGAISSHRELWEAEHPGQSFDAVRPLTRRWAPHGRGRDGMPLANLAR